MRVGTLIATYRCLLRCFVFADTCRGLGRKDDRKTVFLVTVFIYIAY